MRGVGHRWAANHRVARACTCARRPTSPPRPAPTRSPSGVFEGEGIAHDVEDGALGALVDAGEARPGPEPARRHARRGPALDPRRASARATRSTAERAAARGAAARGRAGELGALPLCWELPHHVRRRHRRRARRGHAARRLPLRALQDRAGDGDDDDAGPRLEALVVARTTTCRGRSTRAAVVGAAQNAARDLQNRPANDLTPVRARRPRRASSSATVDGLTFEVAGRERDRRARAWARSPRSRRAPPRSPR